ncbi:MAG: GWxTD domain-containing protein [Acidobacteria bacterium]|nr:GWxTD domain-containing protein [Acidobacteriota bacterium]
MVKVLLAMTLGVSGSAWIRAQEQSQQRPEVEDHFAQWLNEAVTLIIAEEEEEVFSNLTTPEEKERFIEQFWYRRDPDPNTPINEFRDEHYRRIAFANERFQSGVAGWKTDRGRIYIIHGPPDEIVSYPSGGRYLRQGHEGGGSTSTYPFEVWRYRHLGGLGSAVELEFVDASWAGEYRLSQNAAEKDALLKVPNAGLTRAESLGLATKMDRPFFQPGMRGRYPLAYQRSQDSPFARYEILTQVQRPPEIKYKDLQKLVQVDVSFNTLDFQLRSDYFQLNEEEVLVPITVQIQNKNLTFSEQGDLRVAQVAIYGVITTITNRRVVEFEEDLVLSFSGKDFQDAVGSWSTYQRVTTLKKGMRYRLDLVIKDLMSGNIGVVRKALMPLSSSGEELSASSLILSDLIVPLAQGSGNGQMFVLGDIKVRPSVGNIFSRENALGVYLQLYHLGIDQTTQTPWVENRYRIFRDDEIVLEVAGERGEGIRIYSDWRTVLVKALPVEGMQAGEYRLQVDIHDRIRDESLMLEETFELR